MRGAWIEILLIVIPLHFMLSRSPCGERGLKCELIARHGFQLPRRSPCGERGLKCGLRMVNATSRRRSPCGERGLKCELIARHGFQLPRRSPCGERGLKSIVIPLSVFALLSLPMRGAWIEIYCHACLRHAVQSLPMRGAWIEMPLRRLVRPLRGGSLPMRGAWIEIKTASRILLGE